MVFDRNGITNLGDWICSKMVRTDLYGAGFKSMVSCYIFANQRALYSIETVLFLLLWFEIDNLFVLEFPGKIEPQSYAMFFFHSQMTTAIAIEDVRREVKILRALAGHKNLVQFYDAFEDHDNVYIAME